jgi:hypothetical protein
MSIEKQSFISQCNTYYVPCQVHTLTQDSSIKIYIIYGIISIRVKTQQ